MGGLDCDLTTDTNHTKMARFTLYQTQRSCYTTPNPRHDQGELCGGGGGWGNERRGGGRGKRGCRVEVDDWVDVSVRIGGWSRGGAAAAVARRLSEGSSARRGWRGGSSLALLVAQSDPCARKQSKGVERGEGGCRGDASDRVGCGERGAAWGTVGGMVGRAWEGLGLGPGSHLAPP